MGMKMDGMPLGPLTWAWLVGITVVSLMCLLFAWLAWRRAGQADASQALQRGLSDIEKALVLIERATREEQRLARTELAESQSRASQQQAEEARALRTESASDRHQLLETLAQRLQAFEERLAQATERLDSAHRQDREAAAQAFQRFGAEQHQRLVTLTEGNDRSLSAVRETLESRLAELRAGNEEKLEQMRLTVDEKLQSTLNTRLDASFKLVSERLEQVHAGLGEMRNLATGVGDLKRVLGNVKSRGVFGEVQLAAILEELLTPEQYLSNALINPESNERVEFAVKMPGQGERPVLLPMDAKFPREDYERLLDAQERADADAAAQAGIALEQRILLEATKIAEKYIAPPYSTDFAVMFLPTEGLYAEVLRRPGLFEKLQREHRVTITGPTTLSALLNSLRMGFRTLAIEKRSSEVWRLLGAVRTEFGKFGAVLDSVQKQIGTVSNTLSKAGTRSRVLVRKLSEVEALDVESSRRLLGEADMGDETALDEDESAEN